MNAPPILVLHASGTNRDEEAAVALSMAGGEPRITHVNELADGRVRFRDHAAVVLPGGFSYGDSLGAGARLALELRAWFGAELKESVRAGRPVLGICNGFQALVRAGLLAGSVNGGDDRAATLTANRSGRFECRWVTLRVEHGCRASWLAGVTDRIRCPVAHGEGRLLASSERSVATLDSQGLVAFRYVDETGEPAGGAYPDNPNGSAGDIAGLTDTTGAVVGLMPHPEDHVAPWQGPQRDGRHLGLPLFEAFVGAAR